MILYMCVFTVQFYASTLLVVPLQAAHHLSKHTYYIFPRSTHGHIWEMHKLEMYTWKMLKAKYHMKTSAHH